MEWWDSSSVGKTVANNTGQSLTLDTVASCTSTASNPVTAQLTGGATLTPEIGILSTPVIDVSSQTIYAVTANLDNNQYCHKLHALDVTTGAEQPGSPAVLQAAVPGYAFC